MLYIFTRNPYENLYRILLTLANVDYLEIYVSM